MKAKMREVRAAVHKRNAKRTFQKLQELGVLHLSFEKPEDGRKQDETISKLDYMISYPYFEKEKKDVIENFASIQKKLEERNVEELAESGLANMGVYDELKALESKIQEIDKKRKDCTYLVRDIKSLKFSSETPLHKIQETGHAFLFLSKKPPGDAEFEKVGEDLYLCAVLKSGRLPANAIKLNLLGLEGIPKEIIQKALSREKELEKEKLGLINEARKRQALLKSFKASFDLLSADERKNDAMKRAQSTVNTVIMHGWVREKDEKKLAELSDCEFEITDPKGDSAPTFLDNPGLLKPFESITRIFGLPKYTEVDPTPYLSLFFIVSMALCLTDAGYGLMLALLASVLYLRYGLKFGMLLLYGGVLTIAVGVLMGGWWGNLGNYVPLFRPMLYPNGINPMEFLLLSLSIGIIQITMSLLIAAREKVRSGQAESALIDTMPWVVFLMAVVSIGLDSAGAIRFAHGAYIAGACVAFVMLTRGRHDKSLAKKILAGFVAPYDLVAYMADVLSFTRLLALGMTSGMIAVAINMIALLSLGVPVIGILLAPAILILGHTFNLLLSTLSAYIHSSRLQYVEFFSRFYSGGGFAFQPFSKKYKYFKEV